MSVTVEGELNDLEGRTYTGALRLTMTEEEYKEFDKLGWGEKENYLFDNDAEFVLKEYEVFDIGPIVSFEVIKHVK